MSFAFFPVVEPGILLHPAVKIGLDDGDVFCSGDVPRVKFSRSADVKIDSPAVRFELQLGFVRRDSFDLHIFLRASLVSRYAGNSSQPYPILILSQTELSGK